MIGYLQKKNMYVPAIAFYNKSIKFALRNYTNVLSW